jgi:hypothetical protein
MIKIMEVGAISPHISDRVAYIKSDDFSIFLKFEIYIIKVYRKEECDLPYIKSDVYQIANPFPMPPGIEI